MKALVKTDKGQGNIEIREVPEPVLPGEDWVLIQVRAAGVCGTDLHIWHDAFPYWPPVVMGHEFSGVIEKTGSLVRNFKVGDRVVAEPHSLACGVCEECRQGRIQICRDKRSPGWGIDGAFARKVAMPSFLLHRIPDGLSDELAALAEPMAIVIHQVLERGRVEFQDVVVVTGAGPVGIMAAFAAKAAGASRVILVGTNAGKHLRFRTARELGIVDIVNAQEEDTVAKVLTWTDGRGADLVVETSGAAAAIGSTVDMVRKCGRISAIGISSREMVEFPWKRAIYKVLDIVFNMSSSYTSWDRALKMLAAHPELSRLVTRKAGLEDWEQVFRELEEEKSVKSVFIFDSAAESTF